MTEKKIGSMRRDDSGWREKIPQREQKQREQVVTSRGLMERLPNGVYLCDTPAWTAVRILEVTTDARRGKIVSYRYEPQGESRRKKPMRTTLHTIMTSHRWRVPVPVAQTPVEYVVPMKQLALPVQAADPHKATIAEHTRTLAEHEQRITALATLERATANDQTRVNDANTSAVHALASKVTELAKTVEDLSEIVTRHKDLLFSLMHKAALAERVKSPRPLGTGEPPMLVSVGGPRKLSDDT